MNTSTMQTPPTGLDSSAAVGAAKGTQYLTCVCAGEEYGIEILRVQEIRGWDKVTRMPNAAPYVLGIMNLRGAVVPLIDLRLRFNLESSPYNASTVVIVVRVRSGGGERTAGIVADGVSEVYSIPSAGIVPPPDIGQVSNSVYVSGIATVEGKMILLLDVDSLLGASVEAVA